MPRRNPKLGRRSKAERKEARPFVSFELLEGRDVPSAAFALSGTSLIAFDTDAPTQAAAPLAITGVSAGETIVGIDVRPQNGYLYGLGINATADTGTLYAISPRTGLATAVGTPGQIAFDSTDLPDPATTGYGFDFNPAADRIRVTTGSGLNFRLNPNTGAAVDSVAGGAIDPDAALNGGTTSADGAAYTNSQPNNGGITTLYLLDAASDTLYASTNPNAGTTAVVGIPITLGGDPLDFTAINGFDIGSSVDAAASNAPVLAGTGYATLTVGGKTSVYSIDLVTGAATDLGAVAGAAGDIGGLALQSDIAGLPSVALDATGPNLLRFNSATPGTVTTVAISGVAAGDTLVGIDYRPATGQLIALGVNATADNATLYVIDPQTAAASLLVAGKAGAVAFQDAGGAAVDLPDPATTGYGFDFNPTVDRIRVTTGTGLNFRANPVTGGPVDGDLGGIAGSVANTNTDGNINGLPVGSTGVSAAAYTNSFSKASTTTLYTLDPVSDSLYIQNGPNAGTQTVAVAVTDGTNPIDFTDVSGFDIPSGVGGTVNNAVASGVGYAVLTVGGSTSLYTIDLSTGVATAVGTVGAGTAALSGFALGEGSSGTVTFDNSAVTVAEGAGSVVLTLTRTGNTANAATVTVSLTDGTTTAGQDYPVGTSPITVTFAPGATTATATIPITDDTTFEGDETFTATITSAAGGALIGGTPTATVTITDDDTQPTVSIADAKVAEGDTGTTALTFTVTLSNASTQTVTVTADTTDGTATAGSDYTALVGQTITFAPGETSKTVTVDVTGDTTSEADEDFTVTLTAPTNATLGTATATGTVTNDDATPTVSIADATVTEGNAGTVNATFTVTLSNPSDQAVTVKVSTTDGTAVAASDYTAVVGQLVTFAPGETTKTVSVAVTGDTAFEADETFTAALSDPTGGATLGTDTATGTITNDDTAPVVSIGNVTLAEGNTGTTAFTFTVSLANASDSPVTVTVNTADGTAKAGTDYTAVTNQVVTFAPGETSQTVTVNVTGDLTNETNETFTVVLSAPTGGTVAAGKDTGTGTITNDDDVVSVVVDSVAKVEGNSGTTAYVFNVTLKGTTELPVTVTVGTANNTATAGSDYTALTPVTLTFAPGETAKTVTVLVTGDTTVENDETFYVTLSAPTNATLGTTQGTGTIINDDTAPTPSKTLLVGSTVTAVGAGSGAPTVRLLAADGTQVSSSAAFGSSFTGGVRTAVADLNGDGVPDVIVGSGPGTASLVRVLDGSTGKELFSVAPFEASFTGGVFVAAGDVNGDGTPDVVVSPDQGGGPRVDIYSGKNFTKVDSFLGIEDPNFRGGARVAVGDLNGDGVGDLVVAAGFQGGPRVAGYDGKSLGTSSRVKLFADFFAFESTLRNGAYIAVGDIDGDGKADLIAGGGPGGGPRVTAFSGAALLGANGGTQSVLANFFAGDTTNRLGVQIAVKDLDGDGKADLRTAVGGSDTVTTYLGKNLSPTGTPTGTTLDGLPDFNGGVFIG